MYFEKTRAYYQANHCWTTPTFNDLVCWLWVVRNGARCWQQQLVSKPWLKVCCTATSLNLPRIFTLLLWVERGPATTAGDRYSCDYANSPSFATQQRKVPARFQDCSSFSGRAFSCHQSPAPEIETQQIRCWEQSAQVHMFLSQLRKLEEI